MEMRDTFVPAGVFVPNKLSRFGRGLEKSSARVDLQRSDPVDSPADFLADSRADFYEDASTRLVLLLQIRSVGLLDVLAIALGDWTLAIGANIALARAGGFGLSVERHDEFDLLCLCHGAVSVAPSWRVFSVS